MLTATMQFVYSAILWPDAELNEAITPIRLLPPNVQQINRLFL